MNANDLFKAVMDLDLTPIKMKLMHVASGEGWSLEKANAVEKEYRRFLCLMKLFPEEDTAPLVDVDTFWHYHILDTMKYAADCEKAFGYFLHHYPYVGMSGSDDDEQFRLDSGDRMRTLYESIFGEAYPASIETAQASLADVAYCASTVPDHPMNKAAGVAYCASTVPDHPVSKAARVAYCASTVPDHPMSKVARVAYCASTVPDHPVSKAARVAYCASTVPDHPVSKADRVAYCASTVPDHPVSKTARVAYCASTVPDHPVSKTARVAYCASTVPDHPMSKAARVAYCASTVPDHPAAQAGQRSALALHA